MAPTRGHHRRERPPTLELMEPRNLLSFLAPSEFDAGLATTRVAVADVNGDGIPDLVSASDQANGGLFVLLGNGDGSFRPAIESATGFRASAPVIADFNGDGIPDVATASGVLSISLGNGDGTFKPPIFSSFPVTVSQPAVGDLNGDGIPDLVCVVVSSSTGNDSAVVLLGNGNGTFKPPVYLAGGLGTDTVAIADVNGDGKSDLITATDLGAVGVLLGNGDGTFRPANFFPAGQQPVDIAVADFDGDGHPDLVTANYTVGGRTVSVLLGSGDGSFRLAGSYAAGPFTTAVAVGDFNGDGRPDIVTANPTGSVREDGTATVLLGNGDGTFRVMAPFAAGPGVRAVTVADLNQDGTPDLVAPNHRGGPLTVLLGNGNGTFRAPVGLSVGPIPESAILADLNGDGVPDLVTANDMSSGTVRVLLGNGDGTYHSGVSYPAGAYPDAVAAADVNGDGILDLLTPNSSTNSVSVLLGNGDGSFQASRSFATGSTPVDLQAADVNGDGILDLVTADLNASAGGGAVSVLLGNGDGTFRSPLTYAVGAYPESVAVADVNGDGEPDLLVAFEGNPSLADGAVGIFFGNGDGTFQPLRTVFAGPAPVAVKVADLNGDGIPDLAVANYTGPGNVSVLLGIGDGTFQTPQSYSAGFALNSLAVVDVNGDGIPDLAAADSYGTVSVLLGTGDGYFLPALNYYGGPDPACVVAGDVNGDGWPDLITTNPGSGTISLLINAADWSPPPSRGSPGRVTLHHLPLDFRYLGAEGARPPDGRTAVPDSLLSMAAPLADSPEAMPSPSETSDGLTAGEERLRVAVVKAAPPTTPLVGSRERPAHGLDPVLGMEWWLVSDFQSFPFDMPLP